MRSRALTYRHPWRRRDFRAYPVPSSGDWRDQFASLTFDWRLGFGESIIPIGPPSALQAWTDNISGFQLVAPSVGQRPLAGTLGWASTVAAATQLWDIVGNALWQATLGGTASYSFAMRANLTLTSAFGALMGGSANAANNTFLLNRNDGREEFTRNPGGSAVAGAGTLTAASHVLGGSYHPVAGNNTHVFLDGSQVAIANTGTAVAANPLFAFLFARTLDGITTNAATQIDAAEFLVFNTFLNAAAHATVSANLFADYP